VWLIVGCEGIGMIGRASLTMRWFGRSTPSYSRISIACDEGRTDGLDDRSSELRDAQSSIVESRPSHSASKLTRSSNLGLKYPYGTSTLKKPNNMEYLSSSILPSVTKTHSVRT
jgi:hypothetical protein